MPQRLNAVVMGRQLPRLMTAKKIAVALGVPLDDLTPGLGGTDEE